MAPICRGGGRLSVTHAPGTRNVAEAPCDRQVLLSVLNPVCIFVRPPDAGYNTHRPMAVAHHVLINGLSIGSGGGFTVGRELLRHLALCRPGWEFTLALIRGHPQHEPIRGDAGQLPANCRLLWAPPETAGRLARARYEKAALAAEAERRGADRVIQLNGMVVPGLNLPTLCHFQDPWPYRPEAWQGPKDRVIAWLKRRAHATALRRADCAGWTSAYLRDLICGRLNVRPRRSEVFYNGVPEAWVRRAEAGFADDWAARPVELISVSNVAPYKRQAMVVRALPQLVGRPGLKGLTYRIVGQVSPEYRAELLALAGQLGVARHVAVEGRVSDERVQELYARARCFVLMSVCESFGIPAVEAMSFGTPVVTSDCCAMPEVCGPAADLCPTDDLPALVEMLSRALTDESHAADLRRRGAERVRLFTWEATGEKMARALEAMGGTPAAADPDRAASGAAA